MATSRTMIRWRLIALLALTISSGLPVARAEKPAAAHKKADELNPRVLFITAKDSPHSAEELKRLSRPGGDFEHMRARGWKIGPGPENHIQIIDRDRIPDLIQKLNVQYYPTVACVDNGEVVRSFTSGCTTPLDAWTFGFLATGIDLRPPGAVKEEARVAWTGHYPLRGNHWSVEADWTPSREKVLAHLHGPNHENELEPQWHIEDWSYEELRSVHDDLHEKYDTGGGSGGGSPSGGSPATWFGKNHS